MSEKKTRILLLLSVCLEMAEIMVFLWAIDLNQPEALRTVKESPAFGPQALEQPGQNASQLQTDLSAEITRLEGLRCGQSMASGG